MSRAYFIYRPIACFGTRDSFKFHKSALRNRHTRRASHDRNVHLSFKNAFQYPQAKSCESFYISFKRTVSNIIGKVGQNHWQPSQHSPIVIFTGHLQPSWTRRGTSIPSCDVSTISSNRLAKIECALYL